MKSAKGGIISYLVTVIVSVALLWAGHLWAGYDPSANPNLTVDEEYLKAEITEIDGGDTLSHRPT